MYCRNILVTGGAGYIGSHTVILLLEHGYNVVIIDNLSNSDYKVLERIEQLSKRKVTFYQADIGDRDALRNIFVKHQIGAVIHFAGLKAVGESVAKPLLYYQNNVAGSLVLFAVMQEYQINTLVFSSSATVYGNPDHVPIKEDAKLSTTNPYGATKLMQENILGDLYAVDNNWNIAILRYFNPVGAHQSGLIGENPNGIPNNLMPYITQVAVGKLEYLQVFGNDYPTHDGTGVRDYIHVLDLAMGHLLALQYLTQVQKQQQNQLITVNLGTGIGYSVLDVVNTFTEVSGRKIKYQIKPRRAGDIAECYADVNKASALLKFRAQYNLADMCRDSWRWQQQNPNGY